MRKYRTCRVDKTKYATRRMQLSYFLPDHLDQKKGPLGLWLVNSVKANQEDQPATWELQFRWVDYYDPNDRLLLPTVRFPRLIAGDDPDPDLVFFSYQDEQREYKRFKAEEHQRVAA